MGAGVVWLTAFRDLDMKNFFYYPVSLLIIVTFQKWKKQSHLEN